MLPHPANGVFDVGDVGVFVDFIVPELGVLFAAFGDRHAGRMTDEVGRLAGEIADALQPGEVAVGPTSPQL